MRNFAVRPEHPRSGARVEVSTRGSRPRRLLLLGEVYLKMKKYPEAREAFGLILQRLPAEPARRAGARISSDVHEGARRVTRRRAVSACLRWRCSRRAVVASSSARPRAPRDAPPASRPPAATPTQAPAPPPPARKRPSQRTRPHGGHPRRAPPSTRTTDRPARPAFIEHVYKATEAERRPDHDVRTGPRRPASSSIRTSTTSPRRFTCVDLGRDVRVEFPGGKSMEAEVVAVDDSHDLAILRARRADGRPPARSPRDRQRRLADPRDRKPLRRSRALLPRARGAPELQRLAGHRQRQERRVHPDRRRALTGQLRRPDADLRRQGRRRGRSAARVAHRVRRSHPSPHASSSTRSAVPSTTGRWLARDGALGFTWQSDASAYPGFYLGGSIVGYDRIAITHSYRHGLRREGRDDAADRRALRDAASSAS